VKVSLAFQLSLESDVVRRKKVLSLQATDSVQKIYETISGRSGGPPLWPKDFGEMLDNGDMDAELYYGPGDVVSGGSSSASAVQNWQPVLGTAVLSDLAHETSQGPSADLLLRIVEPRQTLNLDGVLGDDRAMYYSRTFLHFKETESDDQAGNLTPRALSDPISQRCSTPMSRVSSRGSLGLLEQAEQERQHRLHAEDYIQRKLLPHLARSGERSRDESDRNSRSGAFSPLHVGTQNLNLSAADRISTHISPAQSEEPAYLPSRTVPEPPVMPSIRNQAPEQVPPTNLDSIKNGWGTSPIFMYGSGLGPDGATQKESQRQDNQWSAPAMPYPQMASLGTANSPSVNGSIPQAPRRAPSSAAEDDDEENNGQFASQAEELFDIVSRNDLPALDKMLRDGVDVNECTAKGSHVLFRAVIKARELDMVLMLLRAGADAHSTDDKGNQVMHFWARATVGRNHLLEMGQALLMAGAEINAQRLNDGMSPLHHVVVGHNNRRGWLDFHKALMLVRHGASIHLRTCVGQLPLSLIAVDGRAATKKLMQLLQYGIPEGSTDWPRCDHVGCAWCQ